MINDIDDTVYDDDLCSVSGVCSTPRAVTAQDIHKM